MECRKDRHRSEHDEKGTGKQKGTRKYLPKKDKHKAKMTWVYMHRPDRVVTVENGGLGGLRKVDSTTREKQEEQQPPPLATRFFPHSLLIAVFFFSLAEFEEPNHDDESVGRTGKK